MENIPWIFDGIGTEIVGLVLGTVLGGFAGYKIGIHKKGKQLQIAKAASKQRQEMVVDSDAHIGDETNVQNTIRQIQKAGNNSEQTQIGRIVNGK